MQLLATPEQMRGIDRAAIDEFGIAGLVLMENAGRAFVDILDSHRPLKPGTRVVIIAGRGNNGGDGYVIGRHLLNRGCRVDILVMPGEASGDALANRDILQRISADRLRLLPVKSMQDVGSIVPPEVIVDAMFGTGFSGKLTGLAEDLATWANLSGAFLASVDIPSGVNAESGRVEGTAFNAHLTVPMGLAKPGHFLGQGRLHSGEVVVADIGIPRSAMNVRENPLYRISPGDVRGLLPGRRWNANKYDVGKVLVVAGSRAFTGAAVLSADAALMGGAGAVILAAPQSLHPILASKLTEVIIRRLPETADGTIAASAIPEIRSLLDWADAIVLGPGLGRNAETDGLVRTLVRETKVPLVLDADGLNAFAGHAAELQQQGGARVLTPHTGELGRLTTQSSKAIEEDRVGAGRAAAKAFGATVVLKGAPTATASPDGRVVLNSTGNSGMATIGAGDVLTGLIATLVAQGVNATDSAMAGAYIHGLAGDIVRDRIGERALRARDILHALADAFIHLEKQ
ncbi:MAG: NAD(P)H-hydrate dehydratase [Bacteroidota bacterium]